MDLGRKSTRNNIEISELLMLIRKNIALIFSFGIIFAAAGFLISSYLLVPVYEANAKMIVNSGKNETNITTDQITSAQNLVNTYAIILRSRTVLQPVIDELNLSVDYEELYKDVSVGAVEGTQVMEISARSTNRETAEKIVTEILDISPDIIIDSVGAGSVKTIEAAYCPEEPAYPDKMQNTILAALFGFITGFAVVVIRFAFRDTIQTDQDILDELEMPVLGVIPAIDSCRETGGKTVGIGGYKR